MSNEELSTHFANWDMEKEAAHAAGRHAEHPEAGCPICYPGALVPKHKTAPAEIVREHNTNRISSMMDVDSNFD